jgi:hypothetical protein
MSQRIGWRAAISSAIPLLSIISSYTNTVGAAWGLRKLSPTYGGNCITVRRSYDNTEMEIGFLSSGLANETVLSNFISAGVTLAATDTANWNTAYSESDTDSAAFITAAGLTNSTHISAVRRLVSALKYEGLWTKLKAVYPFVGGTATSHRFNLKDPRAVAAAFYLDFNGGWTHDSTGALPSGTNGWANTNLVMSSILTPYNAAMGVYIQNDTNYYSNGYDTLTSMTEIGCGGNTTWAGQYELTGRSCIGVKTAHSAANTGTNARIFGGISGFQNSDGICVTDAKGFTMVNRVDSTSIKMQKSDQLSSIPIERSVPWNNGAFLPTIPVSLAVFSSKAATTGTAVTYGGWSNRKQSFAFISEGLTDLQGLKLSRIVERFQQDLGRSVVPAEFGFDAGVGYVKNLYDQGPDGVHLRMNTQHAQPTVAKAGSLLKSNDKLTMELNGLYSGMISENFISTATMSMSSTYLAGAKMGPGSWSGNNLTEWNTIMSVVPQATALADYQVSQFYLPTKHGIYNNGRNLANFNSNPSITISPSYVGSYALSGPAVTNGQLALLNWYSTGSGNTIMISKDNVESSTFTGYQLPVVSGRVALGWISTGNPYNYFANFRLSELIIMKSSYASGYYTGLDASIYFKSQFLKNQADHYGTISIPTVSDADAQNFVTQTGVDTAAANAINTFVKGLKTEGLWTKLVSIMPFVGNTKYKQAFNLKNPHWNNRVAFGSTTVVAADGFVSDGSINGMVNAGISLNSTFTWNNIHMAAYVSNMISGGHSMGASSGAPTSLSINPTVKAFQLSSWSVLAGNGVSVNNSNPSGFYIGNSLSTTMKIYENGTAIVTGTAAATTLNTTPNANVGGSGDSRQSAKYKYASFGYGLTDAQASAYSTLVNTLLTALGKI